MMQTFKQTSDDPYGRHTYEIVLKGNKNKFFEHWEDAQKYWFDNSRVPDFLDFIVVNDKKKSKEKVKRKGFSQ